MPNQTKEVIIRALMDLLGEKSADKVTVKDIVERCGVNRNTFYYHFRDIPDAMDYALRKEIRRIMDEEKTGSSITRTLLNILTYMENKRAILLHIYRSMRQDDMVYYIRQILDYIVDQLAQDLESWKTFPRQEQETLKYFCRCFFEGILKDWMDNGMKYDLRERILILEAYYGESGEKAAQRLRMAKDPESGRTEKGLQ